ncbi:hypothetical protein GCM10011613_15970 [Cellvibrio zantedeschiae]|uniref:DUF2934 domain-containing protein n=1 Tax=Cellvibrio zantedeschiae TaxID=1237077 RepID=A0ABQ3AYM1_9GAMM|nr:DUF2934 domain-containing protein [Cellvibrio zantedeschiae]GGY71880.1 hypothetical protein GCM10011613_15970 [Cellvibrio zantedeschiae]
MNINEQQVREFAYQIWESEGRPVGHSERHWEMASKLVEAHNEEHFHVQSQGDTDTPANEPVEPISPGQPQQQPVSDPIQPGEPPQQPAQPIAVAPPRKSRAKAAADVPAKSLIDTKPIALGTPADETTTKPSAKKPAKPRKSKTVENA